MDRPSLADALTRRDAVLRAFVAPDGSLRGMPRRLIKRLVVLDHVARSFPIGQQWAESEVNDRLRAFHPDVAMLRRHLVEEEFLERRDGRYWRVGGTTDL
ncbi:MAG: DUF2087 domain-containing protein [Actinomycetota bacterium]|nr:DUF2087 domain-containing protein [Actinomycetota bacterium]